MLYKKSSRQRSPNFLHNQPSKQQSIRLGLARRLHETLAQDLVAIGYQLDGLIGDEKLNADNRHELRQIRLQVMELAQNFREEIYLLRKSNREELVDELQQLLAEFERDLDLDFPELLEPAEELLLEAIREIARNAAKHSKGRHFFIRHEMSDTGIVLLIGDDGTGGIALKAGSFGLLAIDEILRQLSDNFHCTSDENGTRFSISIDRQYLKS